MISEKYVIDVGSSATDPEKDIYVFCPINPFGDIVFGLAIIADGVDGEVVGIVDSKGQDSVEEYYERYKDKLSKFINKNNEV